MGLFHKDFFCACAGKNGGVVRVLNMATSDRTLLKNFSGRVTDVAFAHLQNDVILGAVDEMGNMFIYEIRDNVSKRVIE